MVPCNPYRRGSALYASLAANTHRAYREDPKPRINQAKVHAGAQCPECRGEACESNGSFEFRCKACDHRWGREGGPTGEPYGY